MKDNIENSQITEKIKPFVENYLDTEYPEGFDEVPDKEEIDAITQQVKTQLLSEHPELRQELDTNSGDVQIAFFGCGCILAAIVAAAIIARCRRRRRFCDVNNNGTNSVLGANTTRCNCGTNSQLGTGFGRCSFGRNFPSDTGFRRERHEKKYPYHNHHKKHRCHNLFFIDFSRLRFDNIFCSDKCHRRCRCGRNCPCDRGFERGRHDWKFPYDRDYDRCRHDRKFPYDRDYDRHRYGRDYSFDKGSKRFCHLRTLLKNS